MFISIYNTNKNNDDWVQLSLTLSCSLEKFRFFFKLERLPFLIFYYADIHSHIILFKKKKIYIE